MSLGGLGGLLKPWTPGGCLGGVLGVAGSAWEPEQDKDLRARPHVAAKSLGWERGGRIQEGEEAKEVRSEELGF